MGTWFDSVTITDEIAFATDPLAASPTWVDVTDYVYEFTSFVGRQDQWAGFTPGRATLVLDNSDRRFDPEYASGAYAPNVLPMRKYRRTVTYAAVTYNVFTGFIQDWPQQWQQQDSTVTVEVVDASTVLESETLPGSCYESQVLGDDPDIYFPLQEGASPDSVRDIVFGKQLYPTSFSTTAGSDDIGTPLTGTYPLGAASYYEPRGGADPNIVFRDGYGLPIDEVRGWSAWVTLNGEDSPATDAGDDSSFWLSVGSAATDFGMLATVYWAQNDGSGIAPSIELEVFGYNNPTDNRYLASAMTIELAVEAAAREVHVAFTADTSNAKLYINGQLVATTALTAGTDGGVSLGNFFQLGTGWSHLALWETAPTATQILEQYLAGLIAYGAPAYAEHTGTRIGRVLDDIGWQSADRDIAVGSTIHAAYLPAGRKALDYIDNMVTAERGLFHVDGDGDVRFLGRADLASLTASVTFSDDATDIAGGAVEYEVGDMRGLAIDTIANWVTATYVSGSRTAKDATSIADYTTRAETLSTPTLPDYRAAANIAEYEVRERKEPKSTFPILRAALRPDVATKVPALLGLQVGDAVTVKRTPMGVGSEIEATALVLGIGHENRGAEANWHVEVYLGPIPTQLDDATSPILEVNTSGDNSKIGAATGNIIIA